MKGSPNALEEVLGGLCTLHVALQNSHAQGFPDARDAADTNGHFRPLGHDRHKLDEQDFRQPLGEGYTTFNLKVVLVDDGANKTLHSCVR